MTIFMIHNCWLLETSPQPIQRPKISLEFDLPTSKTHFYFLLFSRFYRTLYRDAAKPNLTLTCIYPAYSHTRPARVRQTLRRGWKSSCTCRSRSDPPASASSTAFPCRPLQVILPTTLDVNRDKFRDSSDWSDPVAQILQYLLTIPANSSSTISASVYPESHHVAALFFVLFYFNDDFWSSRAFVGCLSASGFAGAWDWSHSNHGKWKCGSRHAEWAAAANAVGWGSGGHR